MYKSSSSLRLKVTHVYKKYVAVDPTHKISQPDATLARAVYADPENGGGAGPA